MNFLLTPERKKLRLKPVDYGKHMAKLCQMNLSIQEEKVVELLRKVEHDSYWGIVIRDSFVDYSVEKMRELIACLLSQSDDAPDSMFRILGSECYDALAKLKPQS